MKNITPQKLRMRIFGHDIALEITKTSASGDIKIPDSCSPEMPEFNSIREALCRNETKGKFECEVVGDQQPVHYTGMWYIIPDFTVFRRIFHWWYNYDFSEALSLEAFTETYGNWMGNHYYGKWVTYKRNIPKMIGYFGDNTREGQLFIDMIMKKVIQYENRLKQRL